MILLKCMVEAYKTGVGTSDKIVCVMTTAAPTGLARKPNRLQKLQILRNYVQRLIWTICFCFMNGNGGYVDAEEIANIARSEEFEHRNNTNS